MAAGCTALVIQRSSSETMGHASVAGGLTDTGVTAPVTGSPRDAPGGNGGAEPGGGVFMTRSGAAGIRRRRILRRGRISGFVDRPVRHAGRYGSWGTRVIGKRDRRALAQNRNLQRKVGSAYAGTANGAEANDAR